LLVLVCLYIIFKGSGENDALEYEQAYEKVAPTFLTDYDKENPLT